MYFFFSIHNDYNFIYTINFFNILIFVQLYWLIDIVAIDNYLNMLVVKNFKKVNYLDYGFYVSFYIISSLLFTTLTTHYINDFWFESGFLFFVKKINMFLFFSFYFSFLYFLYFLYKLGANNSSYWLNIYSIVIVYCFMSYSIDWFFSFFAIEFLTFLFIGYISNFKFKDDNFVYTYVWVSIISSIFFLISIWSVFFYFNFISFLFLLLFVSWKLGILPFGIWLTYFYLNLPDMALYSYLNFFYILFWFLVISLFFFLTINKVFFNTVLIIVFLLFLSVLLLLLGKGYTDNINNLWVYTTWSIGFIFFCLSVVVL